MFRYLRSNLPHSGILKKMLLFMLAGIILPLLVLNVLYLNLTYADLRGQTVQSYQSNTRQVVMNLDNILEGVGLYTSYPYYNDQFHDMLTKNYDTLKGFKEITRDARIYQSVVHTQVMRYNSSVYGTLLYNAASDISFLGGHSPEDMRQPIIDSMAHLKDRQDYHNEATLLSVQGPKDEVPAHYVLIARPLFNTSTRQYLGYFGVLVEQTVLGEIFAQDTAIDGVRQYVVDQKGKIIHSGVREEIGLDIGDTALAQLYAQQTGTFDVPADVATDIRLDGHSSIVTRSTLSAAPWSVLSIIDAETLYAPAQKLQLAWSIAFALLMAVGVLVVSQVAISVSRPIRKLNHAMADIVKSHDFAHHVSIDSRDEVGELAQSFNQLLDEISRLLTQVVHQEEEKQAAEMRALQAQVNPHFLGNTLNTIKWMANMQCADNIAEATESLIHLMNYALDTGRRFVTVRQELDFTNRYVELMQLRYFGSFDLEFDVEEDVLDCQSIRFMLQPLVDNAIFHGLQNHASRGLLRITAKRVDAGIEFHVWDNGVGIKPEIIAQIMKGERKKERGFNSIGIYNVIERLRLYYGPRYGVEITSIVGRETDVKVTLPALPLPDGKEAPA